MTLRIDLSPEREAALRAKAEAAGISAEEFALRALDGVLSGTAGEIEPEETVGEMIQRIVGEVPEEELRKAPKDLASQVDHYLYGSPKR